MTISCIPRPSSTSTRFSTNSPGFCGRMTCSSSSPPITAARTADGTSFSIYGTGRKCRTAISRTSWTPCRNAAWFSPWNNAIQAVSRITLSARGRTGSSHPPVPITNYPGQCPRIINMTRMSSTGLRPSAGKTRTALPSTPTRTTTASST